MRRGKTIERAKAPTTQVVVDQPGRPHNLYEYDQQRGAMRLVGVVRGGASPWERGHVVNTLTGCGRPLPALILVTIPTSPGCRLQARVLGAAEFVQAGDRRHLVIGVADVDASFHGMGDVNDLPRRLRDAAQTWEPGFQRWVGAEEAATIIREATECFWRDKAGAESGVGAEAVWKVSARPVAASARGEAERHTWAEYLIPSLPMRFQRYVEEMLLADEHVLFFVERPEFAPPGRLAVFRSQKLRQGLLVITNRQILAMLDSLPPDSTMVDWGYVAKATALERIESAWLETREATTEFNLVIGADGGTERYSLLFPRGHERALQEGVRLLDGFVRPGSRAVARVLDAAVDDGRRVDRRELLARYPHLGQLIGQAGEEDVVAEAAARAPEGRGLGPSLVVTPTRVIVFAGARSRERIVPAREIPIASISSVEVLQSVIACRFDVLVPDEEAVERITLKYDYPDSPAFVRAFIALRHLLGRPLALGVGRR